MKAKAADPLKNAKIVFLLGGPGSGKGTQADNIVKSFNFKHLSIGDLFREEIKNKTPLGEQVQELVSKGELVPDELVIEVLVRALGKYRSKCYLIDGFPRTVNQALMLEERIGECQLILNFFCSHDILMERLLGRGKTSGRADDNQETILKRIEEFEAKTRPAIDYYR